MIGLFVSLATMPLAAHGFTQPPIRTVTKRPVAALAAATKTVIIPRDYTVGLTFLGLGLGLDTVPYAQVSIGPFLTLAGILFIVQTVKLRFVVDDSSFSIQQISPGTEELISSGKNVIIGGENVWKLKTFVNYATFPTNFPFPILIYFKETQTDKDTWTSNKVSKTANSPDAIAKGAKPGQPHFFPAICDAKALFEEFEKRGVKKL